MVVLISKDWRISSDPLNWVVEKRRTVASGPNAGQDQWDTCGYYGSLACAVAGMVERRFRASARTTTLKEAVAELRAITREVMDALKP